MSSNRHSTGAGAMRGNRPSPYGEKYYRLTSTEFGDKRSNTLLRFSAGVECNGN